MKKTISIHIMIILMSLLGCARDKEYVKSTPPSRNVIPLPEVDKGRLPKPYEVNGERYYPLPDAEGFVESGKASWYGPGFHGRRTSSGEIYDMYKKSAAHKTLPLATVVKVINLSNNKFTIIPVNDRGPFVKGRVIDLSYAAAKEIDMVGTGLTDVKIIALGKEVGRVESGGKSKPLIELQDFQSGEFTVQVGAFENKSNALQLANRLKVIYDYVNVTVYMDEQNRTFHRVHVSKSKTLTEAGVREKRLESMGFTGAFIVRI